MKKRIKVWQIIVAVPIILFSVIMIASGFSLISDGKTGNGIIGIVIGFLCLLPAAAVLILPLVLKMNRKAAADPKEAHNEPPAVAVPVTEQPQVVNESSPVSDDVSATVNSDSTNASPKREIKCVSIDVLNVRERNANGAQRQAVLYRCYDLQNKGKYEDDGAKLNPYRLPEGWTYAVLIDGVKVGDTSPDDAQMLADLVREGWVICGSQSFFDVSVDESTGESFYTCSIMIDLQK